MNVYGERKPLSRIVFEKYAEGEDQVTKEQFQNMSYSLGHYLEADALEAAFTMLDVDGSGCITYDEFHEWYTTADRWQKLELNEDQMYALHQVHEYFNCECRNCLLLSLRFAIAQLLLLVNSAKIAL